MAWGRGAYLVLTQYFYVVAWPRTRSRIKLLMRASFGLTQRLLPDDAARSALSQQCAYATRLFVVRVGPRCIPLGTGRRVCVWLQYIWTMRRVARRWQHTGRAVAQRCCEAGSAARLCAVPRGRCIDRGCGHWIRSYTLAHVAGRRVRGRRQCPGPVWTGAAAIGVSVPPRRGAERPCRGYFVWPRIQRSCYGRRARCVYVADSSIYHGLRGARRAWHGPLVLAPPGPRPNRISHPG